MAEKKFYVVWKGRKTGIFNNWEECADQVKGFAGAEYKSFKNLAAAQTALNASYEDYKGKHVSGLSPEALKRIGDPLPDSYSVDAACSGNPGLMEYQCVHTGSKKVIFAQGPYRNGTNNVGEFLAIVHALALFKNRDWQNPIYSDSETALAWVKKKTCETKLQPDEQNAPVFDLIQRAETWLRQNDYNNPLLKWESEAWGEIPADYGRK